MGTAVVISCGQEFAQIANEFAKELAPVQLSTSGIIFLLVY